MRKAIFITGGGSGIGRAVAQRFAREGWFVGLADVNVAGLDETAALLPEGASWTARLDVRDRIAWDEALAAFVQASGGRLDVLFNNAGVAHGGPLADNRQDEIDGLIDINFRGVAYGAQAAYPWLKATPGSCLLNTASAAGIYGTAGFAIYSATKFAVRGLTEALDIEWHGDGIRVRDLMPGFIDTPLLHGPAGRDSNVSKRDRVAAAGFEFIPMDEVTEAAWVAIHSEKPHHPVGKLARQLAFAARWMPGRIRKQGRGVFGAEIVSAPLVPQFDLTGRIALVTGASSGFGEHWSRLLAAAGAKVVLAARRTDRLETVAAEIRAGGGEALAVALDVTDEAATVAAYAAAEAAFGTVDTIIANAGVSDDKLALELSADSFEQIVGINLTGVFKTVREGARRLIAANMVSRGRVVIVSSITARKPYAAMAAYAASKAGVLHMSRLLAKEWARKGICVNTILPGYIETEMTGELFAEGSKGGDWLLRSFPRRALTPIAAMDAPLLFFCSDLAAHVTGAELTVDDGQSL